MDLKERGYGDVDWIHLAQDRDRWRDLVNMVMNLRVPWHEGNKTFTYNLLLSKNIRKQNTATESHNARKSTRRDFRPVVTVFEFLNNVGSVKLLNSVNNHNWNRRIILSPNANSTLSPCSITQDMITSDILDQRISTYVLCGSCTFLCNTVSLCMTNSGYLISEDTTSYVVSIWQ
jgi:hypothetical protein